MPLSAYRNMSDESMLFGWHYQISIKKTCQSFLKFSLTRKTLTKFCVDTIKVWWVLLLIGIGRFPSESIIVWLKIGWSCIPSKSVNVFDQSLIFYRWHCQSLSNNFVIDNADRRCVIKCYISMRILSFQFDFFTPCSKMPF